MKTIDIFYSIIDIKNPSMINFNIAVLDVDEKIHIKNFKKCPEFFTRI